MFVAHHFDTHSTTNHPTSPNSDPFPCSLSPAGSVLDGLGFAHPSQSRQLAWPNRVHLRCGLGVSHSVAPDHASRHRPYSVLLVLSRFNNAGLSPALISAPWRTRGGACASRELRQYPTKDYVRLDEEGVASDAPPAHCRTATNPPATIARCTRAPGPPADLFKTWIWEVVF